MADTANTISTTLVKAIEDQIQKLNDAGLYGQAASLYNNAQERFRFTHQQYSDFLKNQGLPQRSASELADWSQSSGATGNYGGQPMDIDAQRSWIQQNILGRPVQNVQMAPGTEPWRQYLDKNPDVRSAYTGYKQGGGNMSEAEFAAHHYNNYGRAEQRTWGDSRPYQVSASQTAPTAQATPNTNAVINGLPGIGPVSARYYMDNPDVLAAYQKARSEGNTMPADEFAYTHFSKHGSTEGRTNPGYGSSTTGGQSGTATGSVAAGAANQGIATGNTASAATQAYFNANPDVAAAFQKNNYGLTADQFAQTHAARYGTAIEGRSYNGATGKTASAATQAYFNANPDIAAEFEKDALGMSADQYAETHFNKYGIGEGRQNTGLAYTTKAPTIDQSRYTARQNSGYGTNLPEYNNLGNVVLPPGQFGTGQQAPNINDFITQQAGAVGGIRPGATTGVGANAIYDTNAYLNNAINGQRQTGDPRVQSTTSAPGNYGVPGMLDDSYMSTATMLPNGTIKV